VGIMLNKKLYKILLHRRAHILLIILMNNEKNVGSIPTPATNRSRL
jgi:hypothetical protein